MPERYTPQETALLHVLDETSPRPLAERLSALAQLEGTDGFAEVPGRALLLLEQCQLAALSGGDAAAYASGLARLDGQSGGLEPIVALAATDCELTRSRSRGEGHGAFDERHRLYHASAGIGFPLVRYRLAATYAREALALGFVDEALAAVQVAIGIAQANNDESYHRDSLMDLALVRSDMGRHAEAMRDSEAALQLAGGDQRIDLLLNRGYILTQADALQEALALYRRVRGMAEQSGESERALTAMLNLSTLHARLGQVQDNLALTADAVAMAEGLDQDYFKGYAYAARAFALIDGGELTAASEQFAKGRALLERAGEHAHLAYALGTWAARLAARDRYGEAYDALARSVEMDAQVRRVERERNAQYLNAMIEAGQKDLAIERLRRENDVVQLQIEKRRLGTAAWGVGLASVTVLALILLLSYLRLRRASQRLAEANASLDYENSHDALTGVHSRKHFVREFDRRKILGPGRAMLALLDVDHFKQINDRYGHAVGDEVLRQVSRRLAGTLRRHDLIARWGGEEFIILTGRLDDGLLGADIAERLRASLNRTPVQVGDQAVAVTASIGYADILLDPDSVLEDELKAVDRYLYRAKSEGRNRTASTALT